MQGCEHQEAVPSLSLSTRLPTRVAMHGLSVWLSFFATWQSQGSWTTYMMAQGSK